MFFFLGGRSFGIIGLISLMTREHPTFEDAFSTENGVFFPMYMSCEFPGV